MVAIPNVRDFLLDSDYYIPHFTKVLINETDTFMHEFSSLILAEITKDVYGTAQLLKHCRDLNFLHERLKSPDPDVKMNTMQIVHNLLQDPIGAEEIIETKVYQGEKIERLPPPHPCAFVKQSVIFQSFDLQLVYELFDSPYTEIQKLALDVVADLVRRNKDDRLHDRFRRTNGLEALLKFLDVKYPCKSMEIFSYSVCYLMRTYLHAYVEHRVGGSTRGRAQDSPSRVRQPHHG